MVFKRRDRRPIWRIVTEILYPRGGWMRAFEYVKHRVRRLPDTPERIARGIFAGVFTTFTPFFGFHLLTAWAIARMVRGNVLAALLGTFFGNPLTYVPIAAISLKTGHLLLGRHPRDGFQGVGLGEAFSGAWRDLWHNASAIFTADHMEWSRLSEFYNEVFLPFMVGGIIPGIVTGLIAYYLSLPLLRAYQKSRRKRLQSRLRKLGEGGSQSH